MLYNVVLVSALQLHESAIKYTYVPYLLNLPPIPLKVIAKHGAELPVLYNNVPLPSYFTHSTLAIHQLSPYPTMSTSLVQVTFVCTVSTAFFQVLPLLNLAESILSVMLNFNVQAPTCPPEFVSAAIIPGSGAPPESK